MVASLSEHQVLPPCWEEAPCRRSLDVFAEATGPEEVSRLPLPPGRPLPICSGTRAHQRLSPRPSFPCVEEAAR